MPRIFHLLINAVLFTLGTGLANAQELTVARIEPPNWWIGMKYDEIQLMVYGTGLSGGRASFDDPRLQVQQYHSVDNDHYAFIDVKIDPNLPPGEYRLRLSKGAAQASVVFPLLGRETSAERHQGFGPADTIYLITPDRFSNGDQSNDRVDGILDEYDPTNDRMRHGGDLQGILNHLDYLQDLGITAVWLNPVLENNGVNSYHGYKATNLYRIDPRFGSNETYRELVRQAHARGIKVIFDHVSNHIGIRHSWVQDLPTEDWLNGSVEEHLSGKHYLLSITDPHADPRAQQQLKTFWFVDKMPDLNQQNPYLSKYLIQNSLWWIEYSGMDGIREDTYPYADQQFLAEWAKAIRHEYPNFNIVGEIWATKPAYIAHFQEKSILPRDFETHLPAVMDFPLMEAFRSFIAGTGKLSDVYAVYAQDFLYTDINNLLVFLDNHDTARAIFISEGNPDRVKLALTILLTARGIPQLLYGTEINMRGGRSHVQLRADFPGGFPGDQRSAFRAEGRTQDENEMHAFVRTLLRIRRDHRAVTHGKMIHYAPTWDRDIYTFLRIDESEKLLVIANGHQQTRTADLTELMHHLQGATRWRDLLSGNETKLDPQLSVPGLSARVFLVEE